MKTSQPRLVVLSGAGMSAESGIATFRGAGGLWEGHRVEEVASPEGFAAHPELVLEFYNQRRRQIVDARPNEGHFALARLEELFDVHVITQNIDDLHERAGSTQVLHLHGEIRRARSTRDPLVVVDLPGTELDLGDLGPDGAQLRPHIVWFGESVPMIDPAMDLVQTADVVIVVGTSLQVYPAAGLVGYAPPSAPVHVVDPNTPLEGGGRVELHRCGAVEGLTRLEARWRQEFGA
jgi:NAD-dependent deacetylase